MNNFHLIFILLLVEAHSIPPPPEENAIGKLGSTIKLTCQPGNLSAMATYQWVKQSSEIPQVLVRQLVVDYPLSSKFRIITSFDLEVRNLTKKDAGTYTCLLKRSTNEEVVIRKISLAILEGVHCSNSSEANVYIEDQTAQLYCTAKVHGKSKPKMYWMDEEGNRISKVIDSSWYGLRVSRADNGNIYKCVIEAGAFETECKMGPISVLYRSQVDRVEIRSADRHSYFTVGDSVTLHCESDGNPRPEISWYVRNTRTNYTLLNTPRSTAQNYVISNLRVADGGLYKCVATNRINGRLFTDASEAMLVIVPDVVKGSMKDNGKTADGNGRFDITLDEQTGSILAFIIGAVFILLLAVLACFVYIRRKQTSRDTRLLRQHAQQINQRSHHHHARINKCSDKQSSSRCVDSPTQVLVPTTPDILPEDFRANNSLEQDYRDQQLLRMMMANLDKPSPFLTKDDEQSQTYSDNLDKDSICTTTDLTLEHNIKMKACLTSDSNNTQDSNSTKQDNDEVGYTTV